MGQLKCVCSLLSKIVILPFWPDGYSVPDAVRDYCILATSSRGMGLGVTVTGAGGL